MMTCSIFCMLIIVNELVIFFAMFIPDALCIRCWVLNTFSFFLFLRSWVWPLLSLYLMLVKSVHSMLIGDDREDKKTFICF